MTEDAGIVTKKKRAVLRTAVTKCISQLEKELQKTEPDDIAVEELLEHLEQKSSSALATVEGFAITAENYAKAVEILKDRFGRKDAIINSHMQKLLSVTPLKRSDDTKSIAPIF
ncbi:DUF5641 domain-containing protein [Trichonephila clavipes]|nr:DUF5641 domain-containing protein [Trichonephila clavipes]